MLAATNSSLFCIIVFYHQLYKQAAVLTLFFFLKKIIYFTECISKKGKKMTVIFICKRERISIITLEKIHLTKNKIQNYLCIYRVFFTMPRISL